MFGAVAGSTSAVQPVEVSPSIARAGSPKLASGRFEGLYVEAASVSSRIAGCEGLDSLGGLAGAAGVFVVVVVFGVGTLVAVSGILGGLEAGSGRALAGTGFVGVAGGVAGGATVAGGVAGVVAGGVAVAAGA
ncbi:MAG TPA: hypothetical protein VEJ23_02970, partial [Solirubrobacteraceae bacterium]|nr:hypothetical protein [Solirubrobacteraceae bacterium]